MYEMEEAQSQQQAYGEESWTQYQGGGVCEEAQRGATARAEEQTMKMGYQWLETSPCCLYCGANGHWAAYCERRVAAEEAVLNQQRQHQGVRRLWQRRVVEERIELRRAA